MEHARIVGLFVLVAIAIGLVIALYVTVRYRPKRRKGLRERMKEANR